MLIRSSNALNNVFTQTPNGFNDDFVFGIGNRVDGKHDTGDIALNHFLNRDGYPNLEMIEFLFDPIKNRTGSKK